MTLNFDSNGNRTSTINNGTTKSYVINALSQYTQDMNGAETHDTKGNLQTAIVNGTTWTYTYDAQNRLTRALATGTDVKYYYDAFGRQIARELNGLKTYSVWDGWSLIQEYDNSGATLLNNYLQGAGMDEMVARFGAGNVNRIWSYQDGRGNTSHIAGDSGNLIERYTYDLGGNPFFWNSSGGSVPASSVGNRFLYSGRDYSTDTKLYDLRNRFYHPGTSRFLQSDPIGFGGGSNLYGYCGNSPANTGDPFGLRHKHTDGGDSGGDDGDGGGDDDDPLGGFNGQGSIGYPDDPGGYPGGSPEGNPAIPAPNLGPQTSNGNDSLTRQLLNGGSSSSSDSSGGFNPAYIPRSGNVTITALASGGGSFAGGGLNGGTHGGFIGGAGGGRGRIRGIYSRQNLRRLDRALPRVFGASAIFIPAQTFNNAPRVNTSFTRNQLAGMSLAFGGDGGLMDGAYRTDNGTIYLSRETLASSNTNYLAEIYFHELGNHLATQLAGSPFAFGSRAPNILGDPDAGAQLYFTIFGNVIPLP